MGIWEKMTPVFRENLECEFKFKAPEKDGFNTVESIAAMLDGRAKVFFAMGGNFAAASPDTPNVEKALQKCDLTVQIITKLNRTALTPGEVSLILPCLGRSEIDRSADTLGSKGASLPERGSAAGHFDAGGTGVADRSVRTPSEQFVSTESTMLNVQMSRGIFEPASEHLRSEPWIVAGLAMATLGRRSAVDWERMVGDYDKIRDAISRVIDGFEDYNERIRNDGGFYLPNPPRERRFMTGSGKALFCASRLEKTSIPGDRLLLTTIRSHNQFNTTIYDADDRYRGIKGERRIILMNTDDMNGHGLKAGQVVDLTSHFEDGERHAEQFIVVPYPIPRGCTAAYFPEANPLVPLGSRADRSYTPTSKSIVISIRPRDEIVGVFEYDKSERPG
jgi:anaerobic selenocysteine-containing dehydrogenase